MAKRNNESFIGKVWLIDGTYIFVTDVRKPRTVRNYNNYEYNSAKQDDEFTQYDSRTGSFYTQGYSTLFGKNQYNQTISISLTPTNRKEAVETSWDEYVVSGIA
jgi:hypothetical protein